MELTTPPVQDPSGSPSQWTGDLQPAAAAAAPADAITRDFTAGNYAQVVAEADAGRWETFAAMGLIGRTREALAGLRRFDLPEARFHEAVTFWIGGDDAAAVHGLAAIDTEHARNLLALIRKPRIQVLGQLPWMRTGPSDFLSWLDADPKFEVRNISFTSQDLGNEPYADLGRSGLLDDPPDIYICKMVEWHLVPPGVQDLPCPIIGASADYDMHIQGIHPWLQLFDQMVVTDQTEWRDVRRLVDVPVFTFPKSFGVPPELPKINQGNRPMDVFISGSVLHPFHQDKIPPLTEVLGLPEDHTVVVSEGFTSMPQYLTLLNSSRSTITYIRHPGAMTTRGLEALAMGCAPVVQEGSSLALFFGEDDGVLTYRPEPGHLRSQLIRINEQWQEFAGRCARGSARVRDEFSLPRVTSQYLRFITYLAAMPRRGARREVPRQRLDQKRMILAKGWLPGPSGVLRTISAANCFRWQQRLEQDATVEDYIDITRELVLAFAGAMPVLQRPVPLSLNVFTDGPRLPVRPLERALELFQQGLERFPRSLVLRFNAIRAALHYGHPAEVDEALRLGRQTLAEPPERWSVGLMEDVFPWDFFSVLFNYREYFDLVTGALMNEETVSADLARLIHASLHNYMSHYEEHLEHCQAAVALDPAFPFYRFRCGRVISELRPDKQGLDEAAGVLAAAGDELLFSAEALVLLKDMHLAGVKRAAGYKEPWKNLERLLEGQKMLQQMGIAGQDSAAWRFSILQPPGAPPPARRR